MIDVPVLVKDALRDGRMKKNYRILVQSQHPVYFWADIYTHKYTDEYEVYSFTFYEDGVFRFHAPSGSGRWYTEFVYNGEVIHHGQTYSDFYYEVLNGTTVNIDYSTTSLVIQKRDSTQEWATDFVIDNNTLVKESVNIDERMCSGDDIKYGLCEGSSLEFQYFNHESIVGRRLQVFLDAQYLAGRIAAIDENGFFTVPADGTYDLTITKGDATGLLISYASGGEMYVDFVPGQTTDTEDLEAGDVVTINGGSDGTRLEIFAADVSYPIPMGFFTVKKCSRQASTGIIKVTAYNKLMSEYLDAKANYLIDKMPSDGADGALSLYSIQKGLLQDYTIYEAPSAKMEVESVANKWLSSTVSFKRIGSSATEWLTEWAEADSNRTIRSKRYAAPDGWANNPYNYNEIYLEITNRKEIADYIYVTLQQAKADFYHFVQNPDTAWANVLQSGSSEYYFVYSCGITVSVYVNSYTWKEIFYTFPELIPSTSSFDIRNIYDMPDRIYNVRSVTISTPTIWGTISGGIRGLISEPPSPIGDSWDDWADYIADNVFEIKVADLNAAENIRLSPSTIPDVTLRELMSANFETICQFGQLSRETDLFSGVELNHERLYPADTLYPADNLYPGGGALSGFKSLYSKLWADEGNVRKWRYLIITYKGLDGNNNEADFTLQRTVNADGTDDYNMSDNWLFRNLVWTAAQVGEYADAMVTKMQDLIWFPYEMWAAGLPYLETGDEIEIPLNGVTYTSYILRRQLKGIQNLQDTYINGVIDIY